MRIILLGLILLTSTSAAFSQSPKKLIFWSGDANCGLKSRAITAPETAVCGQIMTERGPVNTVMYNGVAIAVAFLDDDDRLIVAARITNTNDEVIGFDSDLWGAAHFKTKSGFYAGEKPIATETSIPSRVLIRSMARGAKIENEAGDVVANNQMTTETRRVRRPDGTEFLRTATLTSEQRRLRETALTAKSVPAKGTVNGLVYFRKVKKADFVVYSLSVDETTFVFQLPKAKP